MKLIIDINENVYKDLKEYFEKEYFDASNNCGLGIELAIANGTPLEEELEKIKAEIEQDAFKDVNGSKYIFVKRVNQIIDKYKAELKGENK